MMAMLAFAHGRPRSDDIHDRVAPSSPLAIRHVKYCHCHHVGLSLPLVLLALVSGFRKDRTHTAAGAPSALEMTHDKKQSCSAGTQCEKYLSPSPPSTKQKSKRARSRPTFAYHPTLAVCRTLSSQALFSSQTILQNFSDSPSHRIFRHMHEVLNIDKNKN